MTLINEAWLRRHLKDHSQLEIDSLSIEVLTDQRRFKVRQGMKKGTVKEIMKGEGDGRR